MNEFSPLKRCFLPAILFIAVFLTTSLQGQHFVLGEDVHHPNGLVITVNEINRSTFAGGLGGKGKQDEIRLNLTIVNTGLMTYRIEPQRNFALELSNVFQPYKDPEGKATSQPFNIFPSAQARVNLYFKVPANDDKDPILNFELDDLDLRILCSDRLGDLVSKGDEAQFTVGQAIELSRFYVDSQRYAEAERLIDRALQVEPDNNQLWMLMAAVYEGYGDYYYATDCLNKVNAATISTYTEATEVARQALSLGHYSLVLAVLEPYEAMSRLDDESRIALARAYYYEQEFEPAIRILEELDRKGLQKSIVYFTLGNIYEKTDRIQKAIEYWEKAVAIDPSYAEAYFNIGVGFFKLNNIARAREYWNRVLTLQPDSVILRATQDALDSTEY
jgi:tetratricopeptide (TPR) repeat protein